MLSDVHPDFSSFNSLLYTTILTPSATKVVQEQAMLLPWQALWRAITITTRLPTHDNIVNLLLGAVMLVLLVLAWKRLRPSYRILSIILYAIAFAYYTGPEKPYMGLPRHLLLAFPVFIGAAPRLEKWKGPIAGLSMFGMIYMTVRYIFEAFVP
jgi:hypothetical protein